MPTKQITIAISMTLRVGSMAEQTFNAVERVDEYCHLPEEAAYELSPSRKQPSSSTQGRSHSGGSGGSAAAAAGARMTGQRGKAGADGLREPLLPVSHAGGVNGSSSRVGAVGPVVVVEGGVPEGWPREGSIEFTDVKMRWVLGSAAQGCSLGVSFEGATVLIQMSSDLTDLVGEIQHPTLLLSAAATSTQHGNIESMWCMFVQKALFVWF
jgi:hypothetical protein